MATDFWTEMAASGAMNQAQGFARMWSAGQPEAVKVQYARQAAEEGAKAAERIRMRFFSEQAKQVRQLEIVPLEDELREAKVRHTEAARTTYGPVPRAVSFEEVEERVNAPARQQASVDAAMAADAAAGAKKADGSAAAPPPGPPPMPIVDATGVQEMSATETTEDILIRDPATGDWIKLNSDQGVMASQAIDRDWWNKYEDINKRMASVYAKYPLNPFLNKALAGLMDNTVAQANRATQGFDTYEDRLGAMQNRRLTEAQISEAEAGQARDAFALEEAQAQSKGTLLAARDSALDLVNRDPAFTEMVGDETANKLIRGEKLSKSELYRVQKLYDTYKSDRERGFLRAQKMKTFMVTPEEYDNPILWKDALITRSATFNENRDKIFTEMVNFQRTGIPELDDPEARRKLLLNANASEEEIQLLEDNGEMTPHMKLVIESLAETKAAWDEATYGAELLELPNMVIRQPELESVINNVVEDAIAQGQAEYAAGERDRPLDEEYLRADKYRTFLGLVHDEPNIPVYRDNETKRAVDDLRKRRGGTEVPGIPESGADAESLDPTPKGVKGVKPLKGVKGVKPLKVLEAKNILKQLNVSPTPKAVSWRLREIAARLGINEAIPSTDERVRESRDLRLERRKLKKALPLIREQYKYDQLLTDMRRLIKRRPNYPLTKAQLVEQFGEATGTRLATDLGVE